TPSGSCAGPRLRATHSTPDLTGRAYKREGPSPSSEEPGPDCERTCDLLRTGRRCTVMHDVRLRAFVGVFLLDVLLDLASDVRTGRGTGRGRDPLVAHVLADRAADHGPDRRARDRMLVGLVALDGHFLIPAVFCRGRGDFGRVLGGLRMRARLGVLRRARVSRARARARLLDLRDVRVPTHELIRGYAAGGRNADACDEADHHVLVAHRGYLREPADTLPRAAGRGLCARSQGEPPADETSRVQDDTARVESPIGDTQRSVGTPTLGRPGCSSGGNPYAARARSQRSLRGPSTHDARNS